MILIVHKSVTCNNIAPIYISELLKVYTPSRNLRSSNMSLLNEFVDFVFQNNLDLVAISETWFKPDGNLVPHECTPAGYSLHHIPRPKKTRGGVALLFRSSLSVSMKNDNIDYLTFESLHAEITCNSRSVRLVNIYRPERDVDGKHVNFSSFLQEFEKLNAYYFCK